MAKLAQVTNKYKNEWLCRIFPYYCTISNHTVSYTIQCIAILYWTLTIIIILGSFSVVRKVKILFSSKRKFLRMQWQLVIHIVFKFTENNAVILGGIWIWKRKIMLQTLIKTFFKCHNGKMHRLQQTHHPLSKLTNYFMLAENSDVQHNQIP